MTTKYQTRDETARVKSYKPPNLLAMPAPPPGVEYHWVRFMVHGVDDVKNVNSRLQDGWEFVHKDEHGDYFGPTFGEGKHSGHIGSGDVILMKNAKSNNDARRRYYEEINQQQMAGVDSHMMKEGATAKNMPIVREAHTTVTKNQPQSGSRRVQFDD